MHLATVFNIVERVHAHAELSVSMAIIYSPVASLVKRSLGQVTHSAGAHYTFRSQATRSISTSPG